MLFPAPRSIWHLPVFFLLLCACAPLKLLAQNESLLEKVAAPIVADNWGNPLNNGLNPNSARFGNWFYLDSQGNRFYCRSYDNGVLQKQCVWLNGQFREVSLSTPSQIALHQSHIMAALKEKHIRTAQTKGCVFICDATGDAIYGVIPYGKWPASEQKVLQSLFNFQTINTTSHVTLIWK